MSASGEAAGAVPAGAFPLPKFSLCCCCATCPAFWLPKYPPGASRKSMLNWLGTIVLVVFTLPNRPRSDLYLSVHVHGPAIRTDLHRVRRETVVHGQRVCALYHKLGGVFVDSEDVEALLRSVHGDVKGSQESGLAARRRSPQADAPRRAASLGCRVGHGGHQVPRSELGSETSIRCAWLTMSPGFSSAGRLADRHANAAPGRSTPDAGRPVMRKRSFWAAGHTFVPRTRPDLRNGFPLPIFTLSDSAII